jgi:thiamine pyrophosphate-dependent acetolactate synthase large subunit-like protein
MSDAPADQYDCTEAVLDATPEAAIVANLGVSSFVLIDIDDRPENFYMTGGMGVTTPVGLGLSTAVDRPVTVLEGDGSLLMSLGCLATVGTYGPPNLTVVVWDNSEFRTTGGQPTLASAVDFAGVARDCGIEAWDVSTTEEFRAAYEAAVAHEGPALVRCAVTAERPEGHPALDYGHSHVKHRFREAMTQ